MPEASPNLLTVSVIVPVRDGLDDLKACVARLLAQDYPADLYEIIVADNGSRIPPQEHLPVDERLTVINEPAPGSYTARNAALRIARGEILAFTDADCLPDLGWLTHAVAALEASPSADMVGGAVELYFRHGTPRTGPEWYERIHAFPQQNYMQQGFAVTANMITRRTVMDRLGTFDASLASGGDAEWGRRVRDSGGVQRYARTARVMHPARATRKELLTKSRRTTRGVAVKQLRKPGGRFAVARMLLGHTRSVLRTTILVWNRPEPDTFSGRARYLVLFWSHSIVVMSELLRVSFRRRHND